MGGEARLTPLPDDVVDDHLRVEVPTVNDVPIRELMSRNTRRGRPEAQTPPEGALGPRRQTRG